MEKYLDENNIPNTSTRYSFYFENFYNYPPQKGEDGSFTMTWPMDGPMDGVSVDNAGGAVVSIFKNPGEYIGKKVGLSGEKITLHEYVAIISEVTGIKLNYNQVPTDVFAKFPFPGADDMAVMFEFYVRGNPDRDIPLTNKLDPNTPNFKTWVEKNKDKFSF